MLVGCQRMRRLTSILVLVLAYGSASPALSEEWRKWTTGEVTACFGHETATTIVEGTKRFQVGREGCTMRVELDAEHRLVIHDWTETDKGACRRLLSKCDTSHALTYATIGGIDAVEWSYSGEVIATSNQGQYCAGLLCAHGIGNLGTDGSWEYSGTFRYGDIVGLGHWNNDDGSYDGYIRSRAYPGGPPPLCGEPKGVRIATRSGPIDAEDVPDSLRPCSNGFCESEILRCLKDWTAKATLGQAVSQDEALQADRWRNQIRAEQIALLGGAANKTFDGVSVAGTDLRDYLASRDLIPQNGAEIRFQRVLRRGPDIAAFLVYLQGFQPPYGVNPDVTISEVLPLTLRSGAAKIVVKDAWTVMGLKIKISETGYELSFRPDPR